MEEFESFLNSIGKALKGVGIALKGVGILASTAGTVTGAIAATMTFTEVATAVGFVAASAATGGTVAFVAFGVALAGLLSLVAGVGLSKVSAMVKKTAADQPRQAIINKLDNKINQTSNLEEKNILGHVTSSYFSSNCKRSIAMALIKNGRARKGNKLVIPLLNGDKIKAKIVNPVFFDPNGVRKNGI